MTFSIKYYDIRRAGADCILRECDFECVVFIIKAGIVIDEYPLSLCVEVALARDIIVAMKLRIRGNSLRFRLTQGEVARLLVKERVSESVHFSSSTADLLTYSLEACEHAPHVSAHFVNGEILVDVPLLLVESWANTDQVGIECTQLLGEGRGLHIVIEKDFLCLQPRPGEDQSDNFPHPQGP